MISSSDLPLLKELMVLMQEQGCSELTIGDMKVVLGVKPSHPDKPMEEPSAPVPSDEEIFATLPIDQQDLLLHKMLRSNSGATS